VNRHIVAQIVIALVADWRMKVVHPIMLLILPVLTISTTGLQITAALNHVIIAATVPQENHV
jgi:hypothetical protein